MSLIISNKKTMGDTAVVLIGHYSEEKNIKQQGDLTIIESNNKVIGVNVKNASKHFKLEEGAHSLTDEQISFFRSQNLDFNFSSMFSVGKIISRENHPKSEKLFVLKVQTDKELTIVTNSLNSTKGNNVVVANVGAILPSGLEIKHSKVMGMESEGMLCGGETLGLEKTDGVLIVNDKTEGDKFIL